MGANDSHVIVLRAHFQSFLEVTSRVRIFLQIFVISVPAIVAAFKAVPENSFVSEWKIAITSLEVLLLAMACLAGILVLFTDKSASHLIADAQAISDRLDDAKLEVDKEKMIVAQMESELARSERLNLIVESMRVAVDLAVEAPPSDVNRQIRDMVDLLVTSKNTLFGIGDEQWNFSVYLWNEDTKQLECAACRRPAQSDEDGPHRSWHPGEGHIGKAYQMRRSLVVGDSTNPNVRGFFEAPEHKRPVGYDDAERYRSLAAIPFSLPGKNDPVGVVVASSNVANRFQPLGSGEDDQSVRPVVALGKTLATLLGVINIHRMAEKEDV